MVSHMKEVRPVSFWADVRDKGRKMLNSKTHYLFVYCGNVKCGADNYSGLISL